MAKPIRNTPILYGKDARQFLAEIEQRPSIEERKKELIEKGEVVLIPTYGVDVYKKIIE